MISAVSNDEDIALSIHVPLNTELLAPLCLSNNNTLPLLEFQRLPLPSNDISRVIHVDDYAVPSETATTAIVEDDDTTTDSGCHTDNKWSHLPESAWLAWFLSGQIEIPVGANWSYRIGSFNFEIPLAVLNIFGLFVIIGIISWRVYIHITLSEPDISFTHNFCSIETSASAIDDFVIPSLVVDTIVEEAPALDRENTDVSNEAPQPQDSVQKDSSPPFCFRFVVTVLRARITNLVSNVHHMETQLKTALKSSNGYADEIKTLENWNSALKSANEAQTSQLDACREERDEARERLEDAHDRVDELLVDRDNLEDELEDLKKIIADLETSLDEKDATLTDVRHQLNEAQKAVKELEGEEQDYQDQMEGILEHNVRLGNQVERLGQTNGALQATITRLTKESERLLADARRCRCQGQGRTATTQQSSTLPTTGPSEATTSTTPAAPTIASLGGSPTPSLLPPRAPGFPRAGGAVMYGPPRLNEEGIPTRPMTPQEREDQRAARVRPQGAGDSVGGNNSTVASASEDIVEPKADDEVEESAGQDDHAAEEGRGLGDSRWANVDGGAVDDKGKGKGKAKAKAKEGDGEATNTRRRRGDEDGKKGKEEMKKSKWAS